MKKSKQQKMQEHLKNGPWERVGYKSKPPLETVNPLIDQSKRNYDRGMDRIFGEGEQRTEPDRLKRIVIGTDKELPKDGEKVLAKITIPAKTMGYFYEVVYHNGEDWLPQRVFQDGNKIIDFKPVEECL